MSVKLFVQKIMLVAFKERGIVVRPAVGSMIVLVGHAKPKACKLRGCTALDYIRRDSAPGSRGARLPNWEILGVGTTRHHILGK